MLLQQRHLTENKKKDEKYKLLFFCVFEMDALLNSINKRQATRALLVPEKQEVVDPQAQKAAEEAARAHETHLRELQSYRERVGVHMRRLMQSDDLKFMNYPPSDAEHRFVVAVEAEKCGLVSHEFGEEGIDRFIVVYKPEFEPSDDELARLTLKHTKKMDESRIDNALKEEDTKQAEEERKEAKKRAKIAKKKEAEADETPVVLHAGLWIGLSFSFSFLTFSFISWNGETCASRNIRRDRRNKKTKVKASKAC